MPPFHENPANICINPETESSLGYIFAANSMDLSSFKFFWWAANDARILKQSA